VPSFPGRITKASNPVLVVFVVGWVWHVFCGGCGGSFFVLLKAGPFYGVF
jgi:hypothetical protein